MSAIQTALSGLNAAAKRVATSANNLANMGTTGSLKDGEQAPYSAQTVTQTAGGAETGGVTAAAVPKGTPFVPAYDPGSPFADESGNIGVPNVDIAEEAVNMMTAKASYQASLKTIETVNEMQKELLDSVDREV